MLRFNTYRSKRYLRTKFVEGSYLLASEGTDLELELLDQMRRETQAKFGDIAISDAWKVERLNATQVLIKPGEAFFKGLPFSFRSGNDQLVSGDILSLGTAPVGVTASDDSSGLGKIITFNDAVATPSNFYRFVITATEELITEVEDPFLKNSNLTEATAQKIRLVYKINVVPNSLQTETPIPYRDENSTSLSVTNFPSTGSFASPNFVNQTTITPTAAGNGELISLVSLTGSAGIDGRDIEIVLRNDPGIGGGIVLPNSPTAQQFYFNGKLIDSNGNMYHINAVFNDTVSTQVVLRLDKEPNQPNPEIINTKPFTVIKRDVFVTDDSNGSPQGKLHWPIAVVDFDSTNGVLHQSRIQDLRNVLEQVYYNQKSLNKRVNVVPVNDGDISWNSTTHVMNTAASTKLFNGIGTADILSATSYVLKNDSCLAFTLKYDGSTLNKGNLAITINSVSVNTATLSSVDLSNVELGNVVKDSAGSVFYITNIDDVNDTITLNAAPATGSAVIYMDSYQEGYVKDDSKTYIFAVRYNNKVYVADLELENGETSQIGDGVSQQLLNFIGATSETDSSPNYTSEKYVSDGDSLVAAISKLDSALTGHSGLKIVGGGTLSAIVSVGPPSLLVSSNWTPAGSGPLSITNSTHQFARQITNAAGNFSLAQAQMRARTVGSPTGNLVMRVYSDSGGLPNTVLATSNTISIASLTGTYSEPIFTFSTPPALVNGVIYHYAVGYSSASIDGSNYVQFDSETIAPPNSFDAFYNGSIWSENGGTNLLSLQLYQVGAGSGVDLSFNANLYLEIKGLSYSDNTVSTSESPITFTNDGDVAYVAPNVNTGGPNLTVTVGALNTVPKTSVIIARREGTDIIVGTSSTRLKDGQSSKLYSQMSDENLSFIGASDTADNSPNYSTNNYVNDGDSLVTAVGKLDTALNDHIIDAIDAHDASAISNSPSGNLSSTDVQSALNELQGDIDTNALDILKAGGAQSVASSGGTTVLVAADPHFTRITGTANHTFNLPSTSTLQVGNPWAFLNKSTGDVTIRDSASSVLIVLAPNEVAYLRVLSTGSQSWTVHSHLDLTKVTTTIANNQSSAASVTGFVIDGSRFRSFTARYWVYRTTASNEIVESGTISGAYKTTANSWQISIGNISGEAGVDFTMTSGGQLQYTSSNLAGASYSGNIKWQILDLLRI